MHLSPLAAEILVALPRMGDLVFPSRAGHPVAGLRQTQATAPDAAMSKQAGAEIAPWVLHDLRRTATTIMARLEVLPHVADKVLNHKAGTIRGVAAIYNRFEYIPERKAALEALGRFVGLGAAVRRRVAA